MAYEAEMITYSQKIFYYLLCHGALSDLDAGVNDLYRARRRLRIVRSRDTEPRSI